MAMQFYASPEQIMRDRSELARKGIARGRSAVVLSYSGGVLFVAENLSSALHKVSEIYDRIGFAAVGRYNEFENLRRAGVRMADLNGLSYDRRDVTGRALANAFAQTLGAIFTEQSKPFEVEICVAEVGATRGRRRALPPDLRRFGERRAGADGDGRAGRGDHRCAEVRPPAGHVARRGGQGRGQALGSVGGEAGASRRSPPTSSRWRCWIASGSGVPSGGSPAPR